MSQPPLPAGSDNFRQSFVPQLTSSSPTPQHWAQTPARHEGLEQGGGFPVNQQDGCQDTLLPCSDAVLYVWWGAGSLGIQSTRLRSCTSGPGPGFGICVCVCACSTKSPVARDKILGDTVAAGSGDLDLTGEQGLLCYVAAFPDIQADKGKTSKMKNKNHETTKKKYKGKNQNEKPAVYINVFPNCSQISENIRARSGNASIFLRIKFCIYFTMKGNIKN